MSFGAPQSADNKWGENAEPANRSRPGTNPKRVNWKDPSQKLGQRARKAHSPPMLCAYEQRL